MTADVMSLLCCTKQLGTEVFCVKVAADTQQSSQEANVISQQRKDKLLLL